MGTADDFEAWYRSERTALLRFAFLLCGGDRHAAEDAVADAVARCWPKIRRGRVDDSGAYVRRAVARRVIDRGRRRQVAARHREELEGEASRAAMSSADHRICSNRSTSSWECSSSPSPPAKAAST